MSGHGTTPAPTTPCDARGRNGDWPKKSRCWVDWLPACEVGFALPWLNRRRPYVALHVYHHGYALYAGRSREIKVVLLMWGCRFTNRKTYPMRSWEVFGRWM